MPNDGKLTEGELHNLAGLRIVKGLVKLNGEQWDRLDWQRVGQHLDRDCLVIGRLFWPGRVCAETFIQAATEEIPPVEQALAPRVVLWEIKNEPNHKDGHEGYGPTADDAEEFAEWYSRVFEGLEQAGINGLGWPGLALGEHAHGERTWAKVCRHLIGRSHWIGVHAYWQRPHERADPRLGQNWQYYRRHWPHHRLIATEVADSSCHNPELPQMTPRSQEDQYIAWCRAADAGGVDGATFFMLAGSDDWKGFRLYPNTVRALAQYGR